MESLTDLGLIDDDTELSEIDQSDRTKIQDKMLSPDQLDAAKFPTISAELVGLKPAKGRIGKIQQTHTASVEFTIHGTKKLVECPAAIEMSGEIIKTWVVADLKFTDFGMEPISAVLGTIRNKDEFRVVVRLIASK